MLEGKIEEVSQKIEAKDKRGKIEQKKKLFQEFQRLILMICEEATG